MRTSTRSQKLKQLSINDKDYVLKAKRILFCSFSKIMATMLANYTKSFLSFMLIAIDKKNDVETINKYKDKLYGDFYNNLYINVLYESYIEDKYKLKKEIKRILKDIALKVLNDYCIEHDSSNDFFMLLDVLVNNHDKNEFYFSDVK